MAYFESINGPFRGKVGSVVGCRRGNVAYLRSVPSKSSNPPTKEQKRVQSQFVGVIRQLRPFVSVLRKGFAPMGYSWQRAVSANYNLLRSKIAAGADIKSLALCDLILSGGECPFEVSVVGSGSPLSEVSVSWGVVTADSRLYGGYAVVAAWSDRLGAVDGRVVVEYVPLSDRSVRVGLEGLTKFGGSEGGKIYVCVFGSCGYFSTRQSTFVLSV